VMTKIQDTMVNGETIEWGDGWCGRAQRGLRERQQVSNNKVNKSALDSPETLAHSRLNNDSIRLSCVFRLCFATTHTYLLGGRTTCSSYQVAGIIMLNLEARLRMLKSTISTTVRLSALCYLYNDFPEVARTSSTISAEINCTLVWP
jgi:hypothetical protein